MQSAYHNLPMINGVMQSPGREFAAREVSYEADDVHAQLRLDLANTYPKQANLKSWMRTVRLNRGKDIVVTEDYALEQPAGEITLSLMTPCRVRVQEAGRLLLETADTNEPRVAVKSIVRRGQVEGSRGDDPRRGWLAPRRLARAVDPDSPEGRKARASGHLDSCESSRKKEN